MQRLVALALVIAAVCAVACEDDEPDASGAPDGGDSGPTGPALTVPEALASDLEGPLLVTGFVVEDGGEVRLCEALAESFPPQCGGESLLVEGLAVDQLEGLASEGDVRWTDAPVEVLGTVDAGTLTVDVRPTA